MISVQFAVRKSSGSASTSASSVQAHITMMWYMYILLCDQKMYYVGITNGVKKRMMDHKFKQFFLPRNFLILSSFMLKYTITNTRLLREKSKLRGGVQQRKRC